MDRDVVASPSVVRLAASLTEGATASALHAELLAWLAASPRFRSFATAHAAKIRKKLRGVGDDETAADLRAELRLACLLVADGRASVAWEGYGSGRLGPDFTVTVAGRRPVNLEVTRLRRAPEAAEPGAPWLAKLRQLPPSVPNAIVVAIGGTDASALDVAAGARRVRAIADARDDGWFAARQVAGSRGFHERSQRLGAVFTWCEGGAAAGERATVWRNPTARIPVPEPTIRDVLAALTRD